MQSELAHLNIASRKTDLIDIQIQNIETNKQIVLSILEALAK